MQDIRKLLDTIDIYHISDVISDPFEALRIQVEGGHENVSFDYRVDYHVNNIAVLQIDKSTKHYIFKQSIREISSLFDISTCLESDIPIKISFGNKPLMDNHDNLLVVTCLAQYEDISIQFYIDPIADSSQFYIKMKCYLLGQDVRKSLLGQDGFTEHHIYSNGVTR